MGRVEIGSRIGKSWGWVESLDLVGLRLKLVLGIVRAWVGIKIGKIWV